MKYANYLYIPEKSCTFATGYVEISNIRLK